jgi:hypothetical protein
MENLMEMEYVINGEKYLDTVTKVEETNDAIEHTYVTNEPVDLSNQLPEFEMSEEGLEKPLWFSVADIPEGISIDTWLEAYMNGVILTK